MALTFSTLVNANEWSVSSFGTHASDGGMRICPFAAEVADTPAASTHRTRPISHLDIDSQDLVITATQAQRSMLSAVAPHARWRIFTLREVLALAAREIVEAEREEEPVLAISGGLRHFASILHLRRGFVLPANYGKKSRGEDVWDIVDAHGLRPRQHRAHLYELARDTVALHSRITEFVTSNEPGLNTRDREAGNIEQSTLNYDEHDATTSATDAR